MVEQKEEPSVRLQPLAIDHVALRVQDCTRSEAFYCGLLGCSVAARNEDAGIVHLRAGHSVIDLVALDGRMGRMAGAEPKVETRNMHHVCLVFEAFDVPAFFARLDAQGIEHSSQPQTNLGAQGLGSSFYVLDPDGNLVELKFYDAPAVAA